MKGAVGQNRHAPRYSVSGDIGDGFVLLLLLLPSLKLREEEEEFFSGSLQDEDDDEDEEDFGLVRFRGMSRGTLLQLLLKLLHLLLVMLLGSLLVFELLVFWVAVCVGGELLLLQFSLPNCPKFSPATFQLGKGVCK